MLKFALKFVRVNHFFHKLVTLTYVKKNNLLIENRISLNKYIPVCPDLSWQNPAILALHQASFQLLCSKSTK